MSVYVKYSSDDDSFHLTHDRIHMVLRNRPDRPLTSTLWEQYAEKSLWGPQQTYKTVLKLLQDGEALPVSCRSGCLALAVGAQNAPLPLGFYSLVSITLAEWIAQTDPGSALVYSNDGCVHVRTDQNVISWNDWEPGRVFPLLTEGTFHNSRTYIATIGSYITTLGST